jgi:hypothetical protein
MEKGCRYVRLTKSYRFHPRLLKHTSEPFYENKLGCGNPARLNQELHEHREARIYSWAQQPSRCPQSGRTFHRCAEDGP